MCVYTYVYSVLARDIMCNAFTLHTHTYTHTHTHTGVTYWYHHHSQHHHPQQLQSAAETLVSLGFHLKSEHMQQVSFNCKI